MPSKTNMVLVFIKDRRKNECPEIQGAMTFYQLDIIMYHRMKDIGKH